jgi:hypothetical protein
MVEEGEDEEGDEDLAVVMVVEVDEETAMSTTVLPCRCSHSITATLRGRTVKSSSSPRKQMRL